MTHQEIEAMIFSMGKEPLEEVSSNDIQMLKEHLEHCESCSDVFITLNRVNDEFLSAPMVEPDPGFVMRFEERLLEAEKEKRSQNTKGFILGMVVITSVLMFALGVSWLSSIRFIQNTLMVFFNRLIQFYDFYRLLRLFLVELSTPHINYFYYLMVLTL